MTTNDTDKPAKGRTKAATDQANANVQNAEIASGLEDKPSAEEIIADGDKNGVFGDNPERQFTGSMLTADQEAVARGDDPVHKPTKVDGDREPKIGERILLHTATPIGGQTVNPAIIIGFTPRGLVNARLEFLDGGRANPAGQEYGGLPYGAAQEERGSFWSYPETDDAKK